ncbi:MAG: F0F1 ATP synthase subunit B family protein [Alphaproteobacteria bacterium]|jgi:F-type H+-transporting ATPase subunit b
MPQLDVASYLPQFVWLVIAFITLYFLMSRMALPRVGDVLEERGKRREKDLSRAEELQAEAEAAEQAYDATLNDARASAHDKVTADLAAAHDRTEAAIHDLDQKLAEKVGKAEKEISAARETAMASATDIAAEAAQLAAEKLAGLKVDDASAKAAAVAASGAR